MNPEGRAIEKDKAMHKETPIETLMVPVHERPSVFDKLTEIDSSPRT